uniref:Protein aurora borealis n=1 Tax=Oryzias latipes TaxID=8090 RepID=H2LLD3_ORYLA
MGDRIELEITPETPGRPSIRNPFESPNDYHHLREPLVPSPSVFKSKSCKATPPRFNWSIDEMASLLPVHIDPEEIQRQSFYLSQTRCVLNPLFFGCQTVLSLPSTFDLEKLLGEYYRNDEACDAVQESLSSSSLRRKLFLDGQFSYSSSDSSTPPRSGPRPMCSEGENPVFSSPLSCGISAPTPSTGQFSSSPIQHGCIRDCSLGSIGSPLFPDRSSPAGHGSPTISPILADFAHTPVGSGRAFHYVSSCNESPFVEGCSPIRSCSPHQLQHHKEPPRVSRTKPRVRVWASPPLISPILNPKLQDSQEPEEHQHSDSPSFLPSMDFDPSFPQCQDLHPTKSDRVYVDTVEHTKMEEDKEMGKEEEEEEEDERPSGQLTSSRMGNVSGTESSQMFLSLLAEGSSIRYDSSMQVDSGYNTTSAGTASLIDGLGSDLQSKESLNSNMVEEAIPIIRHTKVKVRSCIRLFFFRLSY